MNSLQVYNLNGSSLEAEAAELRREIVEALYACGGGHYGGSLSVIDIIITLYRKFLRIDHKSPRHSERDRFILSKGHSAIALYAVLRKIGFFDFPLSDYGAFSSPLEGHPDMTALAGVDFSTGSLGQGLSVGLGMAIALRETDKRVWVVLGDGECQEGQIWEAAMLASRLGTSNLCAVIDANNYQEWGWRYAPKFNQQPIEALHQKWSSFGWNALEVDGHSFTGLTTAFEAAINNTDRPTAIIAKTTKGKGFGFIERNPVRFHCTNVSKEEHQYILRSQS